MLKIKQLHPSSKISYLSRFSTQTVLCDHRHRLCGSLCISALTAIQPAFCRARDILRVRNWRGQQERAIIGEFVSFLSIPNVASDVSANIKKNALFIEQMMRDRKIGNIRLLTANDSRFPPARIWRNNRSRRQTNDRLLCSL